MDNVNNILYDGKALQENILEDTTCLEVYSLWKVIRPPSAGVVRKYLLLKSSDVSRVMQTEPMNIPIGNPIALHMDA